MEDYCRAIKEVALPGAITRSNHFYDEGEFREFVVRNINISDMEEFAADFSQCSSVAQALQKISQAIERILKCRLFSGNLAQIGSFYDGSKTGRLNEMDCLFVINEPGVIVKESQCPELFRICIDGTEIRPRQINETLIAAMNGTLSEMSLPDGWTHGGFASSDFSGVRCNGPAVTAMFCTRTENHVSLDISVVIPLTTDLQAKSDFPQCLKTHCEALKHGIERIQSEVKKKQITPQDLHLIGNLVDNLWQPTTALAEADLLRTLGSDCLVKQTLEICKAIASREQGWYEENNTYSQKTGSGSDDVLTDEPYTVAARELLLTQLREYEGDADGKTLNRETLSKQLTFGHIWLCSSERKHFKETLKADVSINTAAIKHIILRSALHMKGAFSGPNKQREQQLVRVVFEELSSEEPSVAHAFIEGSSLSKYSISSRLASIKTKVAADMRGQCECILDEGLAKVGIAMMRHETKGKWNKVAYRMVYP